MKSKNFIFLLVGLMLLPTGKLLQDGISIFLYTKNDLSSKLDLIALCVVVTNK
jgi:hypothetical protein